MSSFEVIMSEGDRRLIRMPDYNYDIEDLKGDCFNPETCPEIPGEEIREQELQFEQRARDEGVWGYEVQRWNSEIGGGWEHVDSIWGFIGNDFEGSGHDTDLIDQLKTR